MKTKDHLQMHQDHRIWTSDIGMWTHDVKIWEEELETLNSSMNEILEKIKKHESVIGNHIKKLIYHLDTISQHDTDTAFLVEGSSMDDELSEGHEVRVLHHKSIKTSHEKLKKYHHNIMIHTKGLKTTLENFDDDAG